MAKTIPAGPTPPRWLASVSETFDPKSKLYNPGYRQTFIRSGKEDPHWISNVGPQTWALFTPADETLIGGRRGGGKSQALIAWFGMGDNSLDPQDPAYISYLNDPSYRGLMLRKEYQSMAEFIDEAMDFFAPFNCKPVDDPVQFIFRSGAIVYTNHLQDPKAFEKYRGWGITRIGIEELTQIEKEQSYVKLLGSLRAKKAIRIIKGKKWPGKLRCQIMSSTNPDGVGAYWVKSRFVKVTSGGVLIPPNTLMRDPVTEMTKLFIPMTLDDNPFYKEDKQYMGKLLAQDEVTQRQWIHGDWDAAAGAYFRDFRPDGPAGPKEARETPWANHVIDRIELRPFWYRFGGGDWGYQHNTVFHKGCKNERDGRIHIYDELKLRQIGSFEAGVLVAKWWLPDLEGLPDKKITLAFSHDAFNKTDATKSRAEQFVEGIKTVLGPYGAFLMKFNDDERAAMERNPQYAQKLFRSRMDSQPKGQLAIGVKPANKNPLDGWQYIVDLLRFRPVVGETEEDIRVRLQATYKQMGVEAYERELSKVEVRGKEVLPKLQIWKRCPELIRGLQEAMHDDAEGRQEFVRKFDSKDGVGGNDGLDSGRYTLMNFKEIAAAMPKSYWVTEELERFQAEQVEAFGEPIVDPTRLAMVSMTQNARFDKLHGSKGNTSFIFPRGSSRRY